MLLGKNLETARGFTLVEMMIALLVVAVVLAIGAPSFYNFIKNNRMLSLVYELRAVLNNARSEAWPSAPLSLFAAATTAPAAVAGGRTVTSPFAIPKATARWTIPATPMAIRF